MMRYTLTILEEDYTALTEHLFNGSGVERAAYLRCRISQTEDEIRLLSRAFIPVSDEDILEDSATHMKIKSPSFLRVMKAADQQKECFVFVHSHPTGSRTHSEQDDIEEAKLFRTAYIRIRTAGVHASLVISHPDDPIGRVWLPNGHTAPIERIRIIGNRFRFHIPNIDDQPVPLFFDRQVRAFGSDIQKLLSKLHVGVVGAGGTGSSVVEQIIRLGVGEITIADGETFEKSNLNRVYGSRNIDDKVAKVKIAERLAADIGLGTKLHIIDYPISFKSVIGKFRNCDVVFGCTDDEWGRSLLTRFAVYYMIPVFDMGVKIDSQEGIIRSIQGRVTTLMPTTACLNCRRRITPERVRAESLEQLDPDQAAELRKEGYVPELEDPAPAVISFTTGIAASAVSEFLHRLTGFMGEERESSELLYLFDQGRIRTNSISSEEECFCSDPYYRARGDTSPLLDTIWRPEL